MVNKKFFLIFLTTIHKVELEVDDHTTMLIAWHVSRI